MVRPYLYLRTSRGRGMGTIVQKNSSNRLNAAALCSHSMLQQCSLRKSLNWFSSHHLKKIGIEYCFFLIHSNNKQTTSNHKTNKKYYKGTNHVSSLTASFVNTLRDEAAVVAHCPSIPSILSGIISGILSVLRASAGAQPTRQGARAEGESWQERRERIVLGDKRFFRV
jgi:hypothetical protein